MKFALFFRFFDSWYISWYFSENTCLIILTRRSYYCASRRTGIPRQNDQTPSEKSPRPEHAFSSVGQNMHFHHLGFASVNIDSLGSTKHNSLGLSQYSISVLNVYKMSGRSASVYTDTSASHEYLCTLIQNFVNYLIINDLKQSCFQIKFKK